MGCIETISASRFPRQRDLLGRRVRVVFHYDTSAQFGGMCVRDDGEVPFVTIFQLDNGRVVLATECQYSEERS